MTELLPNIFAIEVPVVAQNIDIMDCIKTEPPELMYDCAGMVVHESLPPGNYSFICASLNCSEMDAAQITVSKKQLLNLLSKRGLNPELNYAILRKQF